MATAVSYTINLHGKYNQVLKWGEEGQTCYTKGLQTPLTSKTIFHTSFLVIWFVSHIETSLCDYVYFCFLIPYARRPKRWVPTIFNTTTNLLQVIKHLKRFTWRQIELQILIYKCKSFGKDRIRRGAIKPTKHVDNISVGSRMAPKMIILQWSRSEHLNVKSTSDNGGIGISNPIAYVEYIC